MEPASGREWEQLQPQLLTRYERLARDHKELRLKESDTNGKLAVGAISVLAQRSAGRRISGRQRAPLDPLVEAGRVDHADAPDRLHLDHGAGGEQRRMAVTGRGRRVRLER